MRLTDLALKITFGVLSAGLVGWLAGFWLGRILGSANASELLDEYKEQAATHELEWQRARLDLAAASTRINELEAEVATHNTRAQRVSEVEAEMADLRAQWEAQIKSKESEVSRLKVRITELEMMAREVKAPVVNVSPASALPPSSTERDDLKKIYGIGPVLERLLNSHGVYCYRQIAEWTPEDVRRYDNLLGDFRGRIERDKWVLGAKEAYQKKYDIQP